MCIPHMLKISSEVMGRCHTVITDSQKVTESLMHLSTILIRHFKVNANRVLEETRGLIPAQNIGKAEEPPMEILSVMNSITCMVDLLESHLQSEVLPNIPILNERTICAQEQRRALAALEQQFLYILKSCKNEFNNYVSRILKLQQKNDYRNEDHVGGTAVCDTLCRFLKSVGIAVAEGLTGKNYDRFMKIFGLETYKKVLDHYSRLKALGGISKEGGMILLQETLKYHEVVREWQSATVSDSFEALIAIPSLYTVESSSLLDYIDENEHLAKIPAVTIRNLLQARLDMSKDEIQSIMNVIL